ncbi:regulation of enolase protein 1 (concanavalin A-like superfamily) [Arthrobacter sp. PL16]|nr:regulation of enolase protein 1 (concanavalin A-like superfamily) [Arthrobacter sp. PL16]
MTIRGSRSGNALTEHAHVDDEPWRLVRVALLDADATVTAGSFCCHPPPALTSQSTSPLGDHPARR